MTRVFVTVVHDDGIRIGGVYASLDAAWKDLGEVLSSHAGYVDQRDKVDTLLSGSMVYADDPQSGFEIVVWDVDGTIEENVYLVFTPDDSDYPVVPIIGIFTTYEAARECAVMEAFEISEVSYGLKDDGIGPVLSVFVKPRCVRVERLELRAEGRPVMLYSLAEGDE
jgi:hypothetical protein